LLLNKGKTPFFWIFFLTRFLFFCLFSVSLNASLYLDRERLREGALKGVSQTVFMQTPFPNEEQKTDYQPLFEASQESFLLKETSFKEAQKIYEEALLAFQEKNFKRSEALFLDVLKELEKTPISSLEALQKAIEALKNEAPQEQILSSAREFLTLITNEEVCHPPLEEGIKPFHQGFTLLKEENKAYRFTILKLWKETESFLLNPPPFKKTENRTIEELQEMSLLDAPLQKKEVKKGRSGLKPW
jgi:hypothetical protein